MANKISRKGSVLILALIEGLERFSYYGMRCIVVLYMIDSNGFGISREAGLSMFGWLVLLIGILPFFMGLMTDLLFKQEKGVLVGAAVSLVGYLLLCAPNIYFTSLGLLIIAFGSTLVRCNIPILVGRLFGKREPKRAVAFIGLYVSVNIGAFFGVLGVSIIAEDIGYYYGFAIIAVATFLYGLLFVLTKDKIAYSEVDIIDFKSSGFEENETLLDYPEPSSKKNVFVVILLVTLFAGLFWQCSAVINAYIEESLRNFSSIMSWDKSNREGLVSLLVFPIIGLIWYVKEIGSVVLKISFGMITLGIAAIVTFFILKAPESSILLYLLLPLMLMAIAEAAVTPIAMSYITRLSPMKYASTTYGLFLTLTYVAAKNIDYFGLYGFYYALEVYTILMFVVGMAIFVFRKKLRTWADGID